MRTLYRNGRLYRHTVRDETAMLMDGAMIVWTGPERDVELHRDVRVVDLQGALVTPAFVDAHGRYRYKPITSKQVKRDRPEMPRKIVGEMVIIDVQTRTATATLASMSPIVDRT